MTGIRPFFAGLAILLACATVLPAAARADAAFSAWLERTVWPQARAAGVSRSTFDTALGAVAPDRSLPDLGDGPPEVNWQAEFSDPARYFDDANLAALARTGRGHIERWADTLGAIEARYGVPAEIVVAVWGRESAFGAAAMPKRAIPTLATRAYLGRRRDMFLAELIAALRIVEANHVSAGQMASSVSGALGQPQFLPSSYLAHAVDFDGDGRADIWTSVPDTLASIAAYLAAHGWERGAWWGVEARIPDAVSCALEGPDRGRPLAEWRRAGAARMDGSPLPGDDRQEGRLLMPAGRFGPAFVVSANFEVLRAYNTSDLYALFVGNLADRLRGGRAFAGGWRAPAGFSRGDVRRMQERLIAAGRDVGGADGLVGFRTRRSIGEWQAANGLSPSCFPDAALIRQIR